MSGALEENTKALNRLADTNEALLKAMGSKGGEKAADEDRGSSRSRSRDDDKGEDTGSRRGRGRSRDDDGDKGRDEISADDFKKAIEKFVNVESDDEYNRRVEKAIDPVLDKAGVKEIKDLPAKYRQTVLDNIAEYEKGSGSSRRRV